MSRLYIVTLLSHSIVFLYFFALITEEVVMYGCENWTIKKDERQRFDPFESAILKNVSKEISNEILFTK